MKREDIKKLVEDYLHLSDWRVSENSNMAYSLQGLNMYLANSIIARYWLNEVFSEDAAHAHDEGWLHIHDLGYLSPYCVGWDLSDLLTEGFGGVEGKIESRPPKHFDIALNQLVNFFFTMQGEAAGAQAVSDFAALLAPFVKFDNLNKEQVFHYLQSFVYSLNMPTRSGFQSVSWDTPIVIAEKENDNAIANSVLIETRMGEWIDSFFSDRLHKVYKGKDGYYNESPDSEAIKLLPTDNYFVLSFDSNNKPIWSKVVAVIRHKVTNKHYINIKTALGNLKVSPGHSVFILDGDDIREITGQHLFELYKDGKELFLPYAVRLGDGGYSITISDSLSVLNYNRNHYVGSPSFPGFYSDLVRTVFSSGSYGIGLKGVDSTELVHVTSPYYNSGKYIDGLEVLSVDIVPYEYDYEYDITVESPTQAFAVLGTVFVHNSPFTNITVDYTIPEPLKDKKVIYGGKEIDAYYGEFEKEALAILEALNKVFMEGDAKGRVLTFPIPTVNLTQDFPFESDDPAIKSLWDVTAKYGVYYFANYMHGGSPWDVRSMCLEPGELIYVKRGNTVEDITIEEFVKRYATSFDDEGWSPVRGNVQILSMNPSNLLIEWAKVKQIMKVSLTEAVRMKLEDGKEFVVSLDHPIGIYDPSAGIIDIPARDVSVGHYLPAAESLEDGADTYFARVVEKEVIKYDSPVWFYDVELEENHYFVHSDGVVTHNCCRLRLDNRKVRNLINFSLDKPATEQKHENRKGGLFAANPLTGSIGVVTLNLPMIAKKAKNLSFDDFLKQIRYYMELAADVLHKKRDFVEMLTDYGLYPYSKFWLREVKRRLGKYWGQHYNTIGFVGMAEAYANYYGASLEDYFSDEGRLFAEKVMSYMLSVLDEFEQKRGGLWNLEASPAEGASYRLAMKLKQKYPDAITAGTDDTPYLTNSVHVPYWSADEIFELMEHQEPLQKMFTGGTIIHVFLGEKVYDSYQIARFVKAIASGFDVPYFTVTPTFVVCPVHGYIPGEYEYCPYDHTPEQLEKFGIDVVIK